MQTKTRKNHASCQVHKNAPAHTSTSDIMTLDTSPSSSQGELGGFLDGRGDKISKAREGWTKRTVQSEV